MKLTMSRQMQFNELDVQQLNLIIAASGYEARSMYLADNLDTAENAKRLAIGFLAGRILSRSVNDARFTQLGYELIDEEKTSFACFLKMIKNMAECWRGEQFNIFVDYSSMSRDWFGGILHTIRCCRPVCSRINIYFGYSHSLFYQPTPATANIKIGPIRGFSSLAVPNTPTALIIGLGFEVQKALGVKEYIDPAEVFAFYTEPANDIYFERALMSGNADIMRFLPEKNIFRYPANDLLACSEMLSSLCSGLVGRYRVVIAPLGPKPFSLLSMIVSLKLREVEVWRVSSGDLKEPVDVFPNGKISLVETVFQRG